MSEAWIIDACRTPRGIGKVGKGALADIHPQQLAATVLAAIRDRTHWNISNIQPKDPVTLGLCSQRELDAIVAKAAKKAGLVDEAGDDSRLGDDRDALIEELRAEREAATRAAGEAAQEAEAVAWLEAKRAAEAEEKAGR